MEIEENHYDRVGKPTYRGRMFLGLGSNKGIKWEDPLDG
jgi:hypothetical protein